MTEGRAPGRRLPRRRWFVAGGVLLALALLAGWALWRYPPLLDDARNLRATLERIGDRALEAGTGIDAATVASIRTDLAAARTDQGRIAAVVRDDPLVALASVLPPVGHQRAATASLLSASDDLLDALERLLAVADRYVAVRDGPSPAGGETSTMARLVRLIVDSRDDVAAATAAIATARAALAEVPDDAVGPVVAARDRATELIDRFGPMLTTFAEADDVVPAILGWDGRRRYLILAENPAELRPSGGFAGTYGIVEFDGGRLVAQQFRDVALIDGQPGLPYVEPPAPLRNHLLGDESWRLSDVNWAADFPETARDALELYRIQSGDDDVQGVIAITTYALDALMEVLGPVDVPDFGVTVRPGETTVTALALTRPSTDEPEGGRKAFLQSFATVLFDELLSLPVGQLPDLAPAVEVIARERRAAVWFADPEEQALIEELGVDGSVRDDEGDFLHPVDANVGPVSKLNLVTARRLALAVTLDEVGNAHHRLLVTWHNTIAEPGELQALLLAYQDRRVMGSYFRVLVPELSRLESAVARWDRIEASGADSVDVESGRAVFGVYHLVPPGDATVELAWVAPYVVDEPDAGGTRRYALTIQKQAGTVADPIAISIEAPAASRISGASEGIAIAPDGRSAAVETDLRTDLELWLELRDEGR